MLLLGSVRAEVPRLTLRLLPHSALARKLHAALERQKSIYRGAYQALESELIKVQIEDSVLRNLKTVVKVSRDLVWTAGELADVYSIDTG